MAILATLQHMKSIVSCRIFIIISSPFTVNALVFILFLHSFTLIFIFYTCQRFICSEDWVYLYKSDNKHKSNPFKGYFKGFKYRGKHISCLCSHAVHVSLSYRCPNGVLIIMQFHANTMSCFLTIDLHASWQSYLPCFSLMKSICNLVLCRDSNDKDKQL